MKATDEVFAADYDLEQKSKLTELQLKAHILAQQRAMLNANSAVSGATMEVTIVLLFSFSALCRFVSMVGGKPSHVLCLLFSRCLRKHTVMVLTVLPHLTTT